MPRLNYSKVGDSFYNKHGWIFLVRGSGSFPMDMLRYDQCFPTVEMEANIMQKEYIEEKVLISMKTHRPHVTIKRWESFLWNVVEIYPLDKDGNKQSTSGIFQGQFL